MLWIAGQHDEFADVDPWKDSPDGERLHQRRAANRLPL